MGGLLSKNTPSAPATAPASEKRAASEASTNDADATVSSEGQTVEIKKTVEQEATLSKPSAETTDERAFEAIEAITVTETAASATQGGSLDTESKGIENVSGQMETLTEGGDKLITTDNSPDEAAIEVETVAENLPVEGDQQHQEPAEFTVASADGATELEQKLGELRVVPEKEDQIVTKEETEQQPSGVSSDPVEAAVENIQEPHDVDLASHSTDEKDAVPSGRDEQPAVDEHILSDEIAVQLDNQSGDVQKDE